MTLECESCIALTGQYTALHFLSNSLAAALLWSDLSSYRWERVKLCPHDLLCGLPKVHKPGTPTTTCFLHSVTDLPVVKTFVPPPSSYVRIHHDHRLWFVAWHYSEIGGVLPAEPRNLWYTVISVDNLPGHTGLFKKYRVGIAMKLYVATNSMNNLCIPVY